ncbi:hypothetical protein [Granulosicoccus antarcticus]|uniref:Uncharacterized protein n=1 Tax=Granulosicoccus antarcticus IMCC3135 TaxID=1192854 RepID=A0A2Z2NI71_9GAMM|nr:hypothetical protein [Granulosicoccus antarcticus]ASJ70753.1 hypothetical protein IMCC3135_03200 [Granulosicoccus antarcticus IMCC3135]
MGEQARKCVNKSTSVATMIALCVLLPNSLPAVAQDWCAGKVSDRDSRVVSSMAKPAPLQSYTDPAFGTQVTRVTDAPYGTAHRTLYNTVQPWNADESLLMLYHTGDKDAGHHLYNGKTYEYIRPMEFAAADIEGIYWDRQNASALYFVQRRPIDDPLFGKLVKYNVQTQQRSLVADLDPICGSPAQRRGKTAKGGNDIQGLGGDLVGLRCQNNDVNGNSSDISFHVNVRTGAISQPVTLDPAKPQGSNAFGFRPDVAAAPMPSGQRVVIQDSVFDSSMNFLYRLDSTQASYTARNGNKYQVPKLEHLTIGQMPNGNDAIFSPRYDELENGCNADSDAGQGAIVAHDIQSGSCQVMVGRTTGWNYPLKGVHLSSMSTQNPGWVTMTSIGYGNLDYLKNGKSAPLLFSELSLTYANPDNPNTCRLAHTRTMGKSASRGSSYRGAYFGEPHAVMSPSGSRILFNSDWHDSGSVDTYAVNLGSPPALTPTAAVAPSPTLTPALESVTPVQVARVESAEVPEPITVAAATPTSAVYRLQPLVRTNETPARVYINFIDSNQGTSDRVSIARAGSPDSQLLMWLYTNGTQKPGGRGPDNGELGFLQQYLGTGQFEVRLFTNGDFNTAVHRESFTIP